MKPHLMPHLDSDNAPEQPVDLAIEISIPRYRDQDDRVATIVDQLLKSAQPSLYAVAAIPGVRILRWADGDTLRLYITTRVNGPKLPSQIYACAADDPLEPFRRFCERLKRKATRFGRKE